MSLAPQDYFNLKPRIEEYPRRTSPRPGHKQRAGAAPLQKREALLQYIVVNKRLFPLSFGEGEQRATRKRCRRAGVRCCWRGSLLPRCERVIAPIPRFSAERAEISVSHCIYKSYSLVCGVKGIGIFYHESPCKGTLQKPSPLCSRSVEDMKESDSLCIHIHEKDV